MPVPDPRDWPPRCVVVEEIDGRYGDNHSNDCEWVGGPKPCGIYVAGTCGECGDPLHSDGQTECCFTCRGAD